MDETDIDDHESEPSGTSAVLNYCKKKILQPYLQLLSAMGLRPVRQELSGHCRISSVLYYIYFIFVLMLLIAGYILQGMACFRRDRGFCYKVSYKVPVDTCQNICYGNVTFSYVVPSVLHFTAYLYAVYLFRIMENEQLQNLMERAFLMASNNADGTVHQRHLMKRLWLFILLSLLWIALSVTSLSVMMAKEKIIFVWFEESIAPFVQAARLTSICKIFRQLGHEVRGRPFVYVDTPGDTLDTILLYTSSLRMTAKLYEIPISGRCICLGLTVCTVILLTLGQSHFF
ncbi:Nucleolar [Gryllus bimaculatus]|nr:Nucleolar [Gryllus bimaculatus]